MGTETILCTPMQYLLLCGQVKLNDPLMGTETMLLGPLYLNYQTLQLN